MTKRFVLVGFLLAVAFVCLDLGRIQAADQPQVVLPDTGTAGVTTVQASGRYTVEEFDALSDADKREAYLHQPQRLPDNFSSTKYPLLMQAE